MKKILLLLAIAILSQPAFSDVVTDIKTEYRHGQVFVTWKLINNYDNFFYYVYRHDSPITDANIDQAKYLGRIPKDFSWNYFLDLGLYGQPVPKTSFMVINNDPWVQLEESDGLFVATCNKEKTFYYAVTSDTTIFGGPEENKRIVPGSNATTAGVAEHIAPVYGYLQVTGIPLEDNEDLLYDGYVVFGGNVKTVHTPMMGNEGCLAFNWGLIKDNDFSTPKNAATFFFYGGGGNAYDNANGTNVEGMWKVSMEDDLPNFNWDPVGGENTKWIGYNENFDVYGASQASPPPTTGIDYTYTVSRVKWTYDWLLRTFPNDIDSTQIAAIGSSNGCTGALILAYLYPDKISAVDVTNSKLNTEYLDDDNPGCKWNINGTSRNRAEIFLGTLQTDLMSDVPKIKGSGYYSLYEFSNFNYLVADNKYADLPIVFVTSGKTDNVTCWEEKIPFYNTVNQNRSGGFYYWDLRSHKGGSHSIKDRPLELMLRYKTTLSFPAFSNCSFNGNTGDTNNPDAPYYDGDTVGTVNGVLDWDDATIVETATSWEAKIFSKQFQLTDSSMFPTYLPAYVKADITLRRLQEFKNIPDGSLVCLENWQDGQLKQSKQIIYHLNSDGKGLMTFKKAKISKEGNLIKFYKCGEPKSIPVVAGNQSPIASLDLYPNPAVDVAYAELSLPKDEQVTVSFINILGEVVWSENKGTMQEGDYELPLDVSMLSQGVYVVKVEAGTQNLSYRLVKQ